MSQLTDEQKAQIQQLIQSMRDSGASQEEIRDAVKATLQEWGIQLPERSGGQRQLSPWMSQLTDDQKEEIQQLVESLRESGASPKEIRDAVKATLEGWGIEVPERVGRGQRLSPWMSQLTDEQKAQIQQLIQSMRDSGASQEEIRDAVKATLQEWGIQLPPPPQSSGR
jgi:DNA-binding transcriptional regulator YhcF (GntR family)